MIAASHGCGQEHETAMVRRQGIFRCNLLLFLIDTNLRPNFKCLQEMFRHLTHSHNTRPPFHIVMFNSETTKKKRKKKSSGKCSTCAVFFFREKGKKITEKWCFAKKWKFSSNKEKAQSSAGHERQPTSLSPFAY